MKKEIINRDKKEKFLKTVAVYYIIFGIVVVLMVLYSTLELGLKLFCLSMLLLLPLLVIYMLYVKKFAWLDEYVKISRILNSKDYVKVVCIESEYAEMDSQLFHVLEKANVTLWAKLISNNILLCAKNECGEILWEKDDVNPFYFTAHFKTAE